MPNTDISRTGLVILAAGGSTRLGQPKQLLPLPGGSLLRHIATVAVASGCSPIVVVLGSEADRMRPELDGLPVQIVLCPDWEEGMAASLRTGIAALAEASEVETALVLLCDQPLVTPDLLRALIAEHAAHGQPAIASRYAEGEAGAIGPPCLFARTLFPELLALRGPQGAKQLFARLPKGQIGYVAFPGGNTDIDTPEDWERIQQKVVS